MKNPVSFCGVSAERRRRNHPKKCGGLPTRCYVNRLGIAFMP